MATAVLTRLAAIRESYQQQRTLRRELSHYVTQGDLNDLEAAISRAEDEYAPDTQEIRSILAAQRTEVLWRG
jgi:chromosome segregation ATPase